MKFSEVVAQTLTWLQREHRVSYRALKREFDLEDDVLADLKEELIEVKELAVDKDGKMLVWTGTSPVQSSEFKVQSSPQPLMAERRYLTVMFCDLVDSTRLSEQLDPEELREVVQAYQQISATVIEHYDGYIAQYLGDGILVYFGYPRAHEDDAARAIRAGVGIVEALRNQNQQALHPVQVRVGIHTGPVVVGEMGGGSTREHLALGEAPNIAARVLGLAEPNSVVISAETYRLVTGLFDCQELGSQTMKGISNPVKLYRVVGENETRSRFEVVVRTGLTPLIGREHELGLLTERWARARQGDGQAILLIGEPGIGKSRLMRALKEKIEQKEVDCIEFRCSPYYQNSALYPIIDHLRRFLEFQKEESPQSKLAKLAQLLSRYRFPQADTLPLLATLLSLPYPEGSLPLTLSPQKQKEKLLEVLVAWIIEAAGTTPVYCAWEDLHWADPSTLEVLTLLLNHIPTARLLALLAFRPEFIPPWGNRSHLSQITLGRLGRSQVETMIEEVTGGKALPAEVRQQIVAKTDGVPLFVEELTKTVVESGLLQEEDRSYQLTGPLPPLAIPATLQESLLARLDRLGAAREIAQIGATIGREFPFSLIQLVCPVDDLSLHQSLTKLVSAEILYQNGMERQRQYRFKHSLIQDAAYQSQTKSRRQHYHQKIAQVIEQHFTEICEMQPEMVARHYTEAGLTAQAIPYWHKAGQRAHLRSAHLEAIEHLSKGLELVRVLSDTPERLQQELTLLVSLGMPLTATKGFAAQEVAGIYTQARELCARMGETPQLFPVLFGLWRFHLQRGELFTARHLAEQCLKLVAYVNDPILRLRAYNMLGATLFYMGEFLQAQGYLTQSLDLYDQEQHRSRTSVQDPLIVCQSYAAWVLWVLGYPTRALQHNETALSLTKEMSHPHSLAFFLDQAAILHYFRREDDLVRERASTATTVSAEQGFPLWLAQSMMLEGWALAQQGQTTQGITQLEQGLRAYRTTGAEMGRPYYLALLAEAYGKGGAIREGGVAIDEALALANATGERCCEAELYRIKGELLLLLQAQEEAEKCFKTAIEVARAQHAKSWELRATVSLSRLWNIQGKQKAGYQLLSAVYSWFQEGQETKDLRTAKALLAILRSSVDRSISL